MYREDFANNARAGPVTRQSEVVAHSLGIVGCGYIGTALAVAAQRGGWEVHALTRNAERAAELRACGIAVVEARIEEPAWQRVLPRCGAIVYCAAAGGGDGEAYRRAYVKNQRIVAQWLTAHRARVYLYTGSTGVYPQDDDSLVDEEARVGGSARAEVLLEGERVALASGAERAIVLRLAGIYGPGRARLLESLRTGAEVLSGSGEHYLNLIHREDAASAILHAIEGRCAGVFNLSDSQPARKREVVAWLCERLGRPLPGFDGTAARRRQVPSRRIDARRIREVAVWEPRYTDFRAGFAELLPGR